jgi:hypothetical protein
VKSDEREGVLRIQGFSFVPCSVDSGESYGSIFPIVNTVNRNNVQININKIQIVIPSITESGD